MNQDAVASDEAPAEERPGAAQAVCGVAGERQILGDFWHDGAVCVRNAFDARFVDLAREAIDGRLRASMWFPVDPVARESTLEFVAGSHLGPWFLPRTFLDGAARWFPDGALAELPPIDGGPGEFRVIGWELEPGEAGR